MRKVNIPEGATPPEGWLKKAQALTQALQNAKTDEERKAIIEQNEGVWREEKIRNWLLGLFNNKCWYTEAQDSVSAIHVDHYRPKGRVSDIERKNFWEGYWWLAFDWTNYRICGQLINTKKSDVFPLSEGHQATSNNPGSLQLEAPQLIDPITDDARLVSFELDGGDCCRATWDPDADQADKARVDATIEILGLNRLPRLDEKRADIWRKCLGHIADYRAAAGAPQAMKTVHQSKAVRDLKRLIEYNAEFSSVAHACIFKEAPQALKSKVFG